MERGEICISILVPTYRYSRDRMQNPTLVFKAIQKAQDLLDHRDIDKETKVLVRSKLNTVEQQIDYIRLQEGLGIFISPNTFRIFVFPMTVKESVVLGNKFALHDLYYLKQFTLPYYLLALSKKRVPLYRCEGRQIQEIRNDDFPTHYSEEYEYAYPSLGSSTGPGMKNVEGDKSVVAENRQITFLKRVDRSLGKYVKTSTPLIVAGVEEELANFHRTTRHSSNLIGTIKGNYAIDALHMLSELAWEKVSSYVAKLHRDLLNKLEEDLGKNLATDGLRDVWGMTKLGKGLTLVVERDYHSVGYIDPSNEVKLYLNPPVAKHIILPDAVEEIISLVTEKKGNIVVVENGSLERHGRIALLLRYS